MAESATKPATGRTNRSKKKLRPRGLGNYLFVAPAVLFLLIFMVYPVVFNVQISFRDLQASTLLSGDAPFVGLENYRTTLADPVFRETVRNTFVFVVGSLVFQVSIGLALALYYNQHARGLRYMRALYLIAWTIPIVVVGAVFRWLLDGRYGVVNWVLRSVGIMDEPVYWLTEPGSALAAVIFINVWIGIPFNMILLLAGLQGIPGELYEAASVDGASRLSTVLYITLPLLRPALLATLLLGMIYTFKVFDVIWITTQGGPINSTEVLSTLAYKLVFQQFQFGEGAAVLNFLFIVLFVVALGYLWITRGEEVN